MTAAVLSLVEVAQKSFRGWVDALRDEGRVIADPRGSRGDRRACERELPGAPRPQPPPSNVIELSARGDAP